MMYFSFLKGAELPNYVSLCFSHNRQRFPDFRSFHWLCSTFGSEIHSKFCSEFRSEFRSEFCSEFCSELRFEFRSELRSEFRSEFHSEFRSEFHSEFRSKFRSEFRSEDGQTDRQTDRLTDRQSAFYKRLASPSLKNQLSNESSSLCWKFIGLLKIFHANKSSPL